MLTSRPYQQIQNLNIFCKRNANRIFGVTSSFGDITMLAVTSSMIMMGGHNIYMELLAALLFLCANIPLWFSGAGKASRAEMTKIALLPFKQRMIEKAKRTLDPKKYPIESFSALTCLACLTYALIGIEQFLIAPSFGSLMIIVFGLMGMTPTLLQIFAPTVTGVTLRRAELRKNSHWEPSFKHKSEKWLAHNTERLVGGLEVPTNVSMATAGFASGNPAIAAAGVIYTSGYVFYASYVRRDDVICA